MNCVFGCIVNSRPTQVWVTGEGAVVRIADGCHSILAVWSSYWSTQSNLEPSWLLWTLMDDQSRSSCHSALSVPLIGRRTLKGRVTKRTTSVPPAIDMQHYFSGFLCLTLFQTWIGLRFLAGMKTRDRSAVRLVNCSVVQQHTDCFIFVKKNF